MKDFQILLFYRYVFISEPLHVCEWLRALCTRLGCTGRIIVGTEGINATLEGTRESTETFIQELERDARFRGIHYKKSLGTGSAFPKLSVKVRTEIVSGHLGACDIDPTHLTGKRLSPEMLHEWIQTGKPFFIVDMRNRYEHEIGRFADSICPPLENFRDLPKIMKTLSHLTHKTVVTVCTGGIRCEKASGYLLSQGFTDVWQLEGGIVSYMEKYPNEDFEGKLYVFDRRIAMGFYTDDPRHVVIGKCKECEAPCERFVNCEHMWCGNYFLLCRSCEKNAHSSGMLTCPHGCRVRNPKKILNPWKRLFFLWTKGKQA